MSQPNPRQNGFDSRDDAFIAMIDRYFDQVLSPQELAQFNHLLNESSHCRSVFQMICRQDQMLLQTRRPERLLFIEALNDNASEDRDVRADLSAWIEQDSSILIESLDLEQRVRIQREADNAAARRRRKAEAAEHRALQRLMLGQSDPIKPIKHVVIPKAVFYGTVATIAAVLALIILPMFESKPVVTAPIDDPISAPQLVQVAVLVEQVDAKWLVTGSAPVPGSALLNQPIHLVSGLAKVRFNNEAQVILNAPCSIEPLSASRIKVSQGALMVRCDTDASHGFTVLVPAAQIVDLGTGFTVDVPASGLSAITVTEGLIEVAPVSTEGRLGQPMRVSTGRTAMVDPILRQVVVRQPVDVPVASTGQHLLPGDTDPNWRIVAVTDDPGFSPRKAVVVKTENYNYDGRRWNLKWLKNDPSSSQWLSFKQIASPIAAYAQCVYETTMNVPDSVDLSSVRLSGQFIADDQLVAIRINRQDVVGSFPTDPSFQKFQKFEVVHGWRHGRNTIRFVVRNTSEAPSPMGLRVELKCQAIKEIDSTAPRF